MNTLKSALIGVGIGGVVLLMIPHIQKTLNPHAKISAAEQISGTDLADFLRSSVIGSTVSSLPASRYRPTLCLDWQNVSDLFNRESFDELEALFNANDNEHPICTEGVPNIWYAEGFSFESGDITRADAYCKAKPDSPWPLILRGEFYLWYAWQARGTGFANTVTDDGWRLMHERLDKAYTDFTHASTIRPDLVYPYAAAANVAMHNGRQKTALALYRTALGIDPADWETLLALFENSTRKWYGPDNDLMFEFARNIAAQHPEYPYLSRLIVMAHEEMAARCADKYPDGARAYLNRPEVWQEISDIYRKQLSDYPESRRVMGNFLRAARLAGREEEVLPYIH